MSITGILFCNKKKKKDLLGTANIYEIKTKITVKKKKKNTLD